jgi:flagellar L-ring protein precursor FlgH
MTIHGQLRLATIALATLAGARTVAAQDGSLMLSQPIAAKPLTLETGSYIYRELPPAARMKELGQHDIVTVLVNFNDILRSAGNAQSRKTSTLNAVLAKWIRFDGKSVKLAPQADGDPAIEGNYASQYRTQSNLELRNSMIFKVACEIIEIRPNGNLYIEGDWNIENNEERWQGFLSGEVRRESIQPDRTVASESIIHLNIVKGERGQVRDGYARGWFGEWYDKYKPF